MKRKGAWHDDEAPVNADMILDVMRRNAQMTANLIRLAVGKSGAKRECNCPDALAGAILAAAETISPEMRQKLDLIIGRYLG